MYGAFAHPSALIDFNHPLTGQALAFEVQVIGILSSSA
jgi:FKBP-type peptidyl-prolyl cis-trans isomerase 2